MLYLEGCRDHSSRTQFRSQNEPCQVKISLWGTVSEVQTWEIRASAIPQMRPCCYYVYDGWDGRFVVMSIQPPLSVVQLMSYDLHKACTNIEVRNQRIRNTGCVVITHITRSITNLFVFEWVCFMQVTATSKGNKLDLPLWEREIRLISALVYEAANI